MREGREDLFTFVSHASPAQLEAILGFADDLDLHVQAMAHMQREHRVLLDESRNPDMLQEVGS